MTEPATPRIWVTHILSNTDLVYPLDFDLDRPKIDLANDFMLAHPVTSDQLPDRFRVARVDARLPKTMPDAFRTIGGFIVVTEKLRDVLVRFELGRTLLKEVEIFGYGPGAARIPGRYWFLHIAETRDGFVPEQSENVEIANPANPNSGWNGIYNTDVLAVRASAAQGLDLWLGERISRRIFVTDRLHTAILEAKVKSRDLNWVECRVVP